MTKKYMYALMNMILIAGLIFTITGCTGQRSGNNSTVTDKSAKPPVVESTPVTEVNSTKAQPTPPVEAETDSNVSDTYTGDFYIEGKWKSVGDYGFGQAQPGSIVAFDGTNCNFFSPQDTYAFYKEGDKYVLDTTSFLTSENVSFTVTIIDEDNIEVSRASNTTVLKRVG